MSERVEGARVVKIGPTGRPVYARAFRQAVVQKCARPGASVAAVALANGLNANLVHKWCAKYGHTRSIDTATPTLLPVSVTAQAVMRQAGASPEPTRRNGGVIEIDIGAARVRLRGEIDETNVRLVVAALMSAVK